jgi:hypothetical protein
MHAACRRPYSSPNASFNPDRRASSPARPRARASLKQPGDSPVGHGRVRLLTHRRESKTTGGIRGADRDRTGDLLTASQALSQLSYGPNGERSLTRDAGKRRALFVEKLWFGPVALSTLAPRPAPPKGHSRVWFGEGSEAQNAAMKMKATKNNTAPSTGNHIGVGDSSGANVSSAGASGCPEASCGCSWALC